MPLKSVCVLASVCSILASGGIRPSFSLSRCAWDATDIIELKTGPEGTGFRVVIAIKGRAQPDAVVTIPDLAPPRNHAILADLAAECSPFNNHACYEFAPPLRESDRLIVFLRHGSQPAGKTYLTSAIWLQDGTAYAFEQDFNPGPTHLTMLFAPSQRPGVTTNESIVRADLARLIAMRSAFDQATANAGDIASVADLTKLVTLGDNVVTSHALEQLAGGGRAAALALRPLLDDESLLAIHFRILDTIAATRAKDVSLNLVIQGEGSYWQRVCGEDLDPNWDRTYFLPPAGHYLRLLSALKAIQASVNDSEVPAVREFAALAEHCPHLKGKSELNDALAALLAR